MCIETIKDNIERLTADAEYLYAKADEAEARGDWLTAESAERMALVKDRLLSEERDRLERAEDRAAREAAEARLAYHDEHDTLDLY